MIEYEDTNNNVLLDNINSCTLSVLGNRNPGALNVAGELMSSLKNKTDSNLRKSTIEFILKLLDKNITGSRLWYIYKNEANCDINKLLELNLYLFTTEYFYEAYEKYL